MYLVDLVAGACTQVTSLIPSGASVVTASCETLRPILLHLKDRIPTSPTKVDESTVGEAVRPELCEFLAEQVSGGTWPGGCRAVRPP
jgi:hypothetical protein